MPDPIEGWFAFAVALGAKRPGDGRTAPRVLRMRSDDVARRRKRPTTTTRSRSSCGGCATSSRWSFRSWTSTCRRPTSATSTTLAGRAARATGSTHARRRRTVHGRGLRRDPAGEGALPAPLLRGIRAVMPCPWQGPVSVPAAVGKRARPAGVAARLRRRLRAGDAFDDQPGLGLARPARRSCRRPRPTSRPKVVLGTSEPDRLRVRPGRHDDVRGRQVRPAPRLDRHHDLRPRQLRRLQRQDRRDRSRSTCPTNGAVAGHRPRAGREVAIYIGGDYTSIGGVTARGHRPVRPAPRTRSTRSSSPASTASSATPRSSARGSSSPARSPASCGRSTRSPALDTGLHQPQAHRQDQPERRDPGPPVRRRPGRHHAGGAGQLHRRRRPGPRPGVPGRPHHDPEGDPQPLARPPLRRQPARSPTSAGASTSRPTARYFVIVTTGGPDGTDGPVRRGGPVRDRRTSAPPPSPPGSTGPAATASTASR